MTVKCFMTVICRQSSVQEVVTEILVCGGHWANFFGIIFSQGEINPSRSLNWLEFSREIKTNMRIVPTM